jgi:hypothetical protein
VFLDEVVPGDRCGAVRANEVQSNGGGDRRHGPAGPGQQADAAVDEPAGGREHLVRRVQRGTHGGVLRTVDRQLRQPPAVEQPGHEAADAARRILPDLGGRDAERQGRCTGCPPLVTCTGPRISKATLLV